MAPRRTPTGSQQRRGQDDAALDDAPGSSPRLNFSRVEIREYERVVGDNPSCSSGVPVSIGWGHGKTFTMNLEDFESARPPRRAQMDLVLSRGERHRLLVEWGASGQDVIEAIRMIIRVKNQRRQTVNNLGSYDRIEWAFEKFMRGIRSTICSSDANARQLKAQSEKAAAANAGKMVKTQSQATATTVGETVHQGTASKVSRKSRVQNGTGKSKELEDSPPFREVNLVKQEQSDSSVDNGERPAKSLSPEGPPDEFPSREKNNIQVNINDLHEVSKQEEAAAGSRADSITETYDDVDDMSNPQSHDHRSGKRITPRRDSAVDC